MCWSLSCFRFSTLLTRVARHRRALHTRHISSRTWLEFRLLSIYIIFDTHKHILSAFIRLFNNNKHTVLLFCNDVLRIPMVTMVTPVFVTTRVVLRTAMRVSRVHYQPLSACVALWMNEYQVTYDEAKYARLVT